MWVGRLSAEELTLLNYSVGEDSWESFGLQRYIQSILKEIRPECSLEGLMLKLKLQYFGHLMRRIDLFEKTLMLGKIEGRRRRGPQRMRWLDCITDSVGMSLSWRRKQTELDSILGQAVNIRLHAWSPSQWTLNFVPGVCRSGIPKENQTPQMKEPQDLYLDSQLLKRIC